MVSVNAFTGSQFDMTTLSGALEHVDYVPGFLGQMGVFDGRPSRTRTVFFDRRERKYSLIAASAPGAPAETRKAPGRDAISLTTDRLKRSNFLHAHEMQDVRAHGFESDLENAQTEGLIRLADLRQDQELTHEHMRLGAVQGLVLDADGTTVLHDMYADFDETQAAPVNFELTTATTELRIKENEIARGMMRSSKGMITSVTQIHALCGDDFWDRITTHATTKERYLNSLNAMVQRGEATAFQSFQPWAGITYHNYRGTDDGSTVAVAADEAKFFPVGVRGFFAHAMGPDEKLNSINMPGISMYAERIFEREANPGQSSYVEFCTTSYPLYVCTKPDALRSAVAS